MALPNLKDKIVFITGAASGIGAHGSFLNTPMDVVRRIIDINLYGVYS